MRPVRRGSNPQANDYDDYKKAKPVLVSRLGRYCSYCERAVLTQLAVEQIQPKAAHLNPGLQATLCSRTHRGTARQKGSRALGALGAFGLGVTRSFGQPHATTPVCCLAPCPATSALITENKRPPKLCRCQPPTNGKSGTAIAT